MRKAVKIVKSSFWTDSGFCALYGAVHAGVLQHFDRTDRSLFGYKVFVVLSDSMSATDFRAGDIVLARKVDPRR